MSGRRIVVVGDALLDREIEGEVERLCPDAPVPVLQETVRRSRPGGAGLAASLLAADGCSVTLITSLAGDRAAGEFAQAMIQAGVDLFDLGQDGSTPEKIRLRAGQTLLRLDRGRHGELRSSGLGPALQSIMAQAAAVLVSDYGQGITAAPEIRDSLRRVAPTRPVVWDPHPRGTRPVPGLAVVKPNWHEAEQFGLAFAAVDRHGSAVELADGLLRAWRAETVCITRGQDPALLAFRNGDHRTIPVSRATGDVCGAGDRFGASLTRELAAGLRATEAAQVAARDAARFVAGEREYAAVETYRRSSAIGAADPDEGIAGPWSLSAAVERAAAVRRAGGTVVATGGCFDLLHSGHVRMLQSAARLGDYLVVLLNSDSSVRSIKGPDRPLVTERERALLLSSLVPVDRVAIFTQRTPAEALRRLKPDVWAKGGDYEADQLPEREVIADWGGRLAILPFIEERSTTRLIKEAGARAETS